MTPGRFITDHPYLGAAGFLAIVVCVVLGMGAINGILHAEPLIQVALVDSVLAGFGILVLLRLSWGEKAGYTRGIRWWDLFLFIPPVAVALLPLANGIPTTAPLTLAAFAALTLLVGFAEELWFRGLILTSLLPVGIVRATLVSAVCFALPHLLNVLGGIWDPAFTVVDTIAALGLGVTFAALRVRTGSIWPLVGVHALFDFTSIVAIGGIEVQARSLPLLVSSVVVGAVFVAYGLFLLRGTGNPVPEPEAT